MKLHILTAAALVCISGLALAHDDDEKQGSKLGKVEFANSCSLAVQKDFLRGVAMLHSFWYSAAESTFREVLANDPNCAIADWGIAAILMNNALGGVGATPAGAVKAQAAIDDARRIGAKTQRERDYVEAVAAYYEDFGNRSERARQVARSKAYEALAARYPDDDEAQIFNALYIAGTQLQSEQTFAAYRKAAAILEGQFVKHPDHPGVAHYLIHSYDAPPLAEQGLKAARLYAGIAPDAPHALHMPSHIFTRVGSWEESAATNRRSFEVALRAKDFGEAYHATDYSVYAYLQLGRDAAAHSAMDEAFKVKSLTPGTPIASYPTAAMPARYALERGDWKAAAQLEPAGGKIPFTEALTWYARALGSARSGDAAAAEKDAAQLAVLHKTLEDAKNTYWATEVEVQQLTAAGWIAFAGHDNDKALKFMRAAADLEDRNEKHIVTPGRILPARELLGDMLVEAGQPALALKEYEASQVREPNRYRGYAGAARAAEEAGDRAKAAGYYAKLLALAKDADSQRPELKHARVYVAQR